MSKQPFFLNKLKIKCVGKYSIISKLISGPLKLVRNFSKVSIVEEDPHCSPLRFSLRLLFSCSIFVVLFQLVEEE